MRIETISNNWTFYFEHFLTKIIWMLYWNWTYWRIFFFLLQKLILLHLFYSLLFKLLEWIQWKMFEQSIKNYSNNVWIILYRKRYFQLLMCAVLGFFSFYFFLQMYDFTEKSPDSESPKTNDDQPGTPKRKKGRPATSKSVQAQCPFCSKTYAKNSLYTHIKTCKSNPDRVYYICKICMKELSRPDKLALHMKLHEKARASM